VSESTNEPPLSGIRILDLSRVLAGPLCTMVLGDLGADVLKVERPGTGDETREWGPPWAEGPEGRESAYFLAINRNKRAMAADLSNESERLRVRDLALASDVLVENFAPGTMERWGLGYAQLAAENPGLVYCSITGYGSEGPEAGRPGYDFAVQARSGWMAITGEPAGAPMKVGIALVDVLTGQNAAIGILAALRERDRSGRGQRVEVALMDSAVAGLVNVGQAALIGAPTARFGNAHATIVPYQTFAAADRDLVLAVGNDAQWRRLCEVIGNREQGTGNSGIAAGGLGEDPRFATNPARVENREVLVPMLEEIFRTDPAADWIARLEHAGIPCALVQSPAEALRDPAIRERGGIWTMRGPTYGEVEVVGSPIRLSRTPAGLRKGAPGRDRGQD
jgi:crotonobetainyl-CoA:carnitine CoA-transferase CaiB-like acyl-CoA transferase